MDPSESHDPQQDRWAWNALPWVVSSTVHAALLLVLGLLWYPSTFRQAAADAGIRVRTQIIAPGDPNGSEQGTQGLNFSENASGGKYFKDDQGGPAPGGPAARSVQSALAAVAADGPPVSFSGLLPNASPTATGQKVEGGVGNARDLTSGSPLSNRLGSGYANTSVFGAAGKGFKFVYVFDRSGSMGAYGGAPLAAAKAQLIKSLEDLSQTHQFQIVFYNDHPAVFNPTGVLGRLVFATEQNKNSAREFVRSIVADGSTEHEEALQLALRMGADVIFFLTDADEPRLNGDQLAHIERINHGATINAIEFGYGVQGDEENFLVKLARQNNGTHVYVDVSKLRLSNKKGT